MEVEDITECKKKMKILIATEKPFAKKALVRLPLRSLRLLRS